MTTAEAVPATPRPSRLAVVLSAIVLVAYFGFILLASLAPSLMGAVLFGGVSVGIVLAAAVLFVCIVLSSAFVVASNRAPAGA
jgi:uncharacterized membrane protein (DUF485 family)